MQFLFLENSVATFRLNILYNVTKNNFVHFNHVLTHKAFLSYIKENIQRENRATVTAVKNACTERLLSNSQFHNL